MSQIHIRNIAPDFLTFWTEAAGREPAEQRARWQALYEEKHQEIFDLYFSRWSSRELIEPALKRFGAIVDTVGALDPEGSVDRSVTGCARLFDAPVMPLPSVFLVGTFASNAWVTAYHGQPTVFIALEYFRTQSILDATLSHEAAHAYHARFCPGIIPCETAGTALFMEGLATLTSSLLHPDLSDEEQLWFDIFPREWVANWMKQCRSRWPELRERILNDIRHPGPDGYRRWFEGGRTDENLPPRAGYYAGLHTLRRLHGTYSLAEMARWDLDRAGAEAAEALRQIELD